MNKQNKLDKQVMRPLRNKPKVKTKIPRQRQERLSQLCSTVNDTVQSSVVSSKALQGGFVEEWGGVEGGLVFAFVITALNMSAITLS